MHKIKLFFYVLAVLSLLFGCAKPYYGYTKAQWEQLSPEEQASVKSEYEQVLHDKNTMRHEDLIDDRKQQVIDLGVSKSGG